MVNQDYGHWNIEAVGEFDPKDFFGFVYEITEKETGKKYIGRKQIKVKSKKSDNWREYTSSSKDLVSYISEVGKDKFEFRILLLCSGKSQLTYEEEKLQFENDVLRAVLPNGEKKFFNKTIGYRNFGGVIKQTELSRQKISRGNTGKVRTEEQKVQYSVAKRGTIVSDKTKERIRQANIGKKYPKEVNRKKGKGPNGETLWWWHDDQGNQIRAESCPGAGWVKGRLPYGPHKNFTQDQKIWIMENNPSVSEISRRCGVCRATVRNMLKKKRKS